MFEPTDDRVVIRPDKIEDEKTVSGLVIPQTTQRRPNRATVVAVGPGRLDGDIRVEVPVSVGDRILFSEWAGIEINDGSDKLLIVDSRDILARITEEV